MAAAICKEILLTNPFGSNEIINTIYFGGGTPSLLSKNELNNILKSIQNKFIIAPDAEITLEANPDDINTRILQDWLLAGVNRLSLGIQSFNEAELKWMNRAHNASQSLQSIDDIQAAGFRNFSVDLIYGSPLLSNIDFEKNINIIIEKNIPHISAYALTVEEKTALHHMIEKKKSLPVDEERQAEQFEILLQLMKNNGYEQYEISNFALPGYRSKHNSSYWQGKPYYGFGPSAHSFDGNKTRRWNVANNALYLSSIENSLIPSEEETLTLVQQMNEFIMIRLRTIEGINIKEFENKFGEVYTRQLIANASDFIEQNLLENTNNHIMLTSKGKFLADGIAGKLFFDTN